MRRLNWTALILILVALAVAGIASVKCAKADPVGPREPSPLRFRQFKPAYIATDYSTSEDWRKDYTPYLKAQASMAMSILRSPVGLGPASLDPELAFSWKANLWPIGAPSSPIQENIYMPEAFIRFNEDESGWWRGARAGWMHASSGTDTMSASIDRVLVESKFGAEMLLNDQYFLYLTGYVRGWWVAGVGSETADIVDYINFARLRDFGGEVMLTLEVPDVIRVVGEFGLSYQHYEVYIPLADAYDIDLFGQLWNGNANGINNYQDRATSGGVGLALVR
ncbi:MAG: phospholipase A [Candidatus Krumholzibacteria bacterium]|nr:phospholipase A [Candidatus Krumholzibacteria bacterium]